MFVVQMRAVNGHVLKLALCALLVLSSLPAVSAAGPLDMQLFAQVTRAGGEKAEITVEDGGVLRSGDGVQVRVRATQDAYVYVIALGSSGRAELLYPLSGRSGESRVSAGEERVVPAAGIYVPLDGQTGREAVFGIASTVPINDIDALLRRVQGRSGEPTAVTQMLRGSYSDVSALVFRHIGRGPLRGVDYMAQDMARRISRQPRARSPQPPAPERKYGLSSGAEGTGPSSSRGWSERPPAGQAASVQKSSADTAANAETTSAPGVLVESQPVATFAVPEESEPEYEEPGVLSGEGSRIQAIMGGGRGASGSPAAEVAGTASSGSGGTSVAMGESAQQTAPPPADRPTEDATGPESKKDGGLLDRLLAWRQERSQTESTRTGDAASSMGSTAQAETASDETPRKISAPGVTIEVPAPGASAPEQGTASAAESASPNPKESAPGETDGGMFGRLRGLFAAEEAQPETPTAKQKLDAPPAAQSDVAAASGAGSADAPRTFALPGDPSESNNLDARLAGETSPATSDTTTSASERPAAEELTVTAVASDSDSGSVTETPDENVAESADEEQAPRGGLLSSLGGLFGSEKKSEAVEEALPPAMEATASAGPAESAAVSEEPPLEETSPPAMEVTASAEPAESAAVSEEPPPPEEAEPAPVAQAEPAGEGQAPRGGLLSSLGSLFGSEKKSEAAEETPPPAMEVTPSAESAESAAVSEEPPPPEETSAPAMEVIANAEPAESAAVSEEPPPPEETPPPAVEVTANAEPAESAAVPEEPLPPEETEAAPVAQAEPAGEEQTPRGGLLSSLGGFFGSKSTPDEGADTSAADTDETGVDEPAVSPVVTEAPAPQEAAAVTESAQAAGEGSGEQSESGVLSSLGRLFSSGDQDAPAAAPEPAKPAVPPKPALIRSAPPQEAESGPVVILRGTGPKKKDKDAPVLGSEGSKIRQFLGEEAPEPEPEEPTVTTTAAAAAPQESTVVETTSERPPAAPPVVTVMVDDALPQVASLPAQALDAIAITPARALAEIDVTAPDNVASAVVLVVTPSASGSGVILDNDGHILTNWHLVRHFSAVSVLFKDPGKASPAADGSRVARVLRVNKFADLALLKVDSPPETARPIDLAPSVDLKRGQPVHTLGHPKGGRWTHSEAMVFGVKPTHTWFGGSNVVHRGSVLTARVADDPGQSGAPILNSALQMVAISSHLKRPAGVLTSVTVDTVRQFLATPPENASTGGGG